MGITLIALQSTNAPTRKLAIEMDNIPNRRQKEPPYLIACDKLKFALSSTKKPRKCGASWYNIITLKLALQLLWG